MTAHTAAWAATPERSNMLMLRVMTWISLHLGRRVARVVLYGIALYFLLFSPASRTASRAYLQRIDGACPVGWRQMFQHFLSFASVIHDRVYLVNDQFDLFDIRVQGGEAVKALMAQGQGAFLLGAHLGSFEVLRAVGRQYQDMRVAMVMYEDNARKINAMLRAINPRLDNLIVPLGTVNSMMVVSDLLDTGAVVGILADRTVAQDNTLDLPFLGGMARFPLGPFRMAALLRRPVVFMAGLYRGGNRYDIHFETIADFSATPRGEREQAVREAMERYVQVLESHCRAAPLNWFNFFDFWPAPQEHVHAMPFVPSDAGG